MTSNRSMESQDLILVLRCILTIINLILDGSAVKNPPAVQEMWVNPWIDKIPWRREWYPIPVFVPGESHGERSLVGYSPWGCKRVRHNWATKQQQCWQRSWERDGDLQLETQNKYQEMVVLDCSVPKITCAFVNMTHPPEASSQRFWSGMTQDFKLFICIPVIRRQG